MCGVDFLEESCSTIASLVLNILEPSDFRLKDKTPQGMLLEVERTESKKTLNAQCSAGENKAGRFASFKTVLCSLSELEVIKWAIWQKSSFYLFRSLFGNDIAFNRWDTIPVAKKWM